MTTSDIIATCSLLVAVLAFVATFYQLRATHQHNKLSLRTHLDWHIERRAQSDGTTIAYILHNNGLGPAVIKDRYFSRNGVRFHPPADASGLLAAFMDTVLGTKIHYRLNSQGLPGVDSAIPSQGRFVIGELFFPSQSTDQVTVIEELAGEVHFDVTYESMYGDSYHLSSAGRGITSVPAI